MDMHPEDIKAEIRKRGATLASVADSAGVSTQAISTALATRSSARLETLIAQFLGISPHSVWPSRYHVNGTRIRLRAQSESERSAA